MLAGTTPLTIASNQFRVGLQSRPGNGPRFTELGVEGGGARKLDFGDHWISEKKFRLRAGRPVLNLACEVLSRGLDAGEPHDLQEE